MTPEKSATTRLAANVSIDRLLPSPSALARRLHTSVVRAFGEGGSISRDKFITQLGILLFGCSAVWMVGRPESWSRWGYVLGLCSQPFWFYMSIKRRDWGVFLLNWLYLYSWAQGTWYHWN
jgi:hypothetical protein